MSHHEREVIGVDDRVSPARAIPRGELFAHGASNTVP